VQIFGDEFRVVRNTLRGGLGLAVTGSDGNTVEHNIADRNLKDGFHVEIEDDENEPSEGNVLDDNRAMGNQAEGIENDGVDTVLTDNTSMDNRTDCAGDGTVAMDSGNVCADGSTFTTPGEVDRVGR